MANFNGTDTFNYTISDADGRPATGLVTVTVTSVIDSYTYNGAGGAITDNGTTVFRVQLTDSYNIGDLNVRLGINHPRDSDLTVTLISPIGTRILLFSGVGGTGANFTNTILDSQATQSITSVRRRSPALTGRLETSRRLTARRSPVTGSSKSLTRAARMSVRSSTGRSQSRKASRTNCRSPAPMRSALRRTLPKRSRTPRCSPMTAIWMAVR